MVVIMPNLTRLTGSAYTGGMSHNTTTTTRFLRANGFDGVPVVYDRITGDLIGAVDHGPTPGVIRRVRRLRTEAARKALAANKAVEPFDVLAFIEGLEI